MGTYNLDTLLIDLSNEKSGSRHWTIRDACEGVQIFGGIGSGKTSGSGRTFALKYLMAGFGGLVLTVKPDEKDLWEHYCHITGRSDDLLIVEPGRQNYFNFLEYESSQSNDGNAITENIVQVLKTVIRASEEKSSGKSDDAFWENALDMLIFNVIDLCKLAYGKISLQNMYDIVQSLPKNGIPLSDIDEDSPNAFFKAFKAARKNIKKQNEEWEQAQTVEYLRELMKNGTYHEAALNAIDDARLFSFVDQFFLESFVNLSEKTRSIIDFSFSGFLFRLLREPVYSLFCRHSSIFTPEDCLNGKIILINLPVKVYQKIGRDCQILFKYIWQRTMEKRNVKENNRPVFLWADEAQNFLHEHDPDYQATARSSCISTVYLSQNLPNYLANMGGTRSDHKVKSFLGTLATKIFHANADIETNKYASDLVGDDFFIDESKTATSAGQFSSSHTRNLKIDKALRAEQFSRLKTGTAKNNFIVEAYMHLQGYSDAANFNYIKLDFDQNYIPKP